MRLEEHYLKLYRGLRPRGLDGGTEATLAELAGVLHCTERNVKLLLRGMKAREWIRWEPGRGRGNRSRLELRAEPDRLLLEQVKERLAHGRLREAMALAELGPDTPDGRRQLAELLQEAFGYRREPAPDEKAGPVEVLRFPSYRQLGPLDPVYTTRRTELHMIRQLFDTLVRYDRGTDRFLPGLAHHWERAADEESRERWIFALQKHVRFHNGKPLTARDAAYTLERLRGTAGQPQSPYAPLYEGLETVAALDEFRLEIRLRKPLGFLLGLLASPAASIVSAGLTADFAFRPVGTGPFRLAERESRFLALEAFADYYKRRAHLDRVEMWCLPSAYDGNEASEAEDKAELGGLNFRHFRPNRESGESRLQEHWLEETNIDRGCKFIVLNWRGGPASPWADAGLRELLAAVLRSGSVQLELDGNRGPLANRFIQDLEGSADATASPHAPDRKDGQSSGLHATSRHAYGTPACRRELTLRLVTYAGAGHERDAAWLQRALAPHGVRLELSFVPYEALFEEETLAAADLYMLEQPVQEDAEWTLLALLANANSPVRRCLPPELSEWAGRLCAELPGEPSRTRRLELLGRLEEALLRERAVVLWYRWQQSASYPPGLRDVSISSLGWVDYRKLWFDGRHEDGGSGTPSFRR
ncbi:ABC transporter substrate-binding protein [Paenibacillus ehimensis]|uniref:ABC transporter substrate-binding protein n=1 Tax=Paenibacillus ehimensis TaxID=79264 RepID=UPI003D2DE78B